MAGRSISAPWPRGEGAVTGLRPTLDDVRAAAARIRPWAHRTPVLSCRALDERAGGSLFFKCENFQKGGAFKFRGAANAVFTLSASEAQHGVVTHSSGNHAQALALAAQLRGISAHIVMPQNAPHVKVEAVRGYGAQITFCEPTLAARVRTAQDVLAQTHGTLVHPYDDPRIIAGQGTAALELIEEVPDLDLLLAPLGGGGLLSGGAIAAKGAHPTIQVIGCEPANADDGYRSLRAGRIMLPERTDTIADGLRTGLGEWTFPILWEMVDDVVLVTEEEILDALRLVFERMKIVVEPSAVVPLAAVLSGKVSIAGRRTGIILSGGNVDLVWLGEALRTTRMR